MCGRTTLTKSAADIARWLNGEVSAWQPRFNLCPGQDLLAVRLDRHGATETVAMRWGLIPSWVTNPAIANQCINARAETIDSKPAFRDAYLRGQRCLIVVDGWYEWTTLPSRRRQPYAIRMPDRALFAFAGLWDTWRSPLSGEAMTTCTIVTTVTGRQTAHLHHRVPVVLAPADYSKWLDPKTPPTDLRALLTPYAGGLDVFAVSMILNDGTTDEPRCLDPVTDEAEPSLWGSQAP